LLSHSPGKERMSVRRNSALEGGTNGPVALLRVLPQATIFDASIRIAENLNGH